VSKCKIPGCDKEILAKDYCKQHYKKFISRPKQKAKKAAIAQVVKETEEVVVKNKEIDIKTDSDKAKVQLTASQLEKIFLSPCRTEQELKNYIKFFFGLHLPDFKVSRYADTTPFHAIWEVYNITVNKQNPKNIQEILYVAGRGSGKCVQRGTKILTKIGLKNIEDVNVGDEVFTGWSWRPVVQTFDEGVKDGVTVTSKQFTKNGAWSITGSLKHRVQALDPQSGKIDWIYMRDLVAGQILYRSMESLTDTVDTISSDYELGWLVGCITGDGSVSRHDNTITFAAKDNDQLIQYLNLINKHFNIHAKVKKDKRSDKLNIVYICSSVFRSFYESYIDGELCYFKKLKSLNHSPSFLAGFISGMMETDGSKDSLTLANPVLIEQIAQILNVFGVHAVINKRRREPSTTKFVKNHIVEYHAVDYKTPLPKCLMPLFSKRQAFISYADKMNQQFRYPSKLLKPFADYIKNKYEISNGYWRLESGKKTHSNIEYSKDLWGSGQKSKESYVYGYKIDYFIKLANQLAEHDWADYLRFIRHGCYETVDTVVFGKHYFYDLEIDTDHAYWSNGFISHNTLGMAIAELMVLIHDQRDVVHVGAILSQAKRCYEYQQKFLLNDRIKPIVMPPKTPEDNRILEKTTMERSVFNVGSEKITLEVLPCTLKALNGPHVPLVVVDEIDTVSGESVKAYKEISGMLDSKRGKRPLRVGISTRKTRYGLMNQAIENAEKQGRNVRRWTAFEFTERCPDSRSGTSKLELYIDQNSFDVRVKQDYEKLAAQKQKDYERHEMYDGCLKCPLAPICLGDAKKQVSKSPMLKSIDELAQKVLSEGPDWAMAQLMNLKPSVEGIIYKEFDERTHVKSWNHMWLILTGKEFPGECNHDIFVKKCFSEDTEVLTNNGFKLFKDLTEYDTIATLDDCGKLKYQKPMDHISYRYKGKMVNLYNEIGGGKHHLDLLMTPNHDVEYLHGRNFRKKQEIKLLKQRADSLDELNDFYIPATWLSGSSVNDTDIESPISFMTGDQFMAFMGLWLSEGSMSSIRAGSEWGHNQVEVSQSKSREASDKVEQLMASIAWPSKLHRESDTRDQVDYTTNWSIYNKELYNYLKPLKFAVNKLIPRNILEKASRRQLSILLEWLCFGDGSYMFDGSKQQPYYSTGSEKLANDVQELCFRLGYKSSLSIQDNQGKTHKNTGTEYLRRFRVNFHFKTNNKPADRSYYINNGTNKSEYSNKIQTNISEVDYDAMVYCVTMPSSRLFVRRNGVISLSGNCHSMGLQAYAGIDWGWSNPHTLVVFFVDSRENIYVVRCDGQTYISRPAWMHIVKHKWHNNYRTQLYFPDMADPGDAQEMRKMGLPTTTNSEKANINTGIQVIKKWLRTPGSNEAKIFFASETCKPLIQEFQLYHFKADAAGNMTDDPDTEHDHWLDALRYCMVNLFGKNTIVLGSAGVDLETSKIVDSRGHFIKPPTPEEYAKVNNIPFSSDYSTDNIGKIGKLSELDEEEEKSAEGGFIWTM